MKEIKMFFLQNLKVFDMLKLLLKKLVVAKNIMKIFLNN